MYGNGNNTITASVHAYTLIELLISILLAYKTKPTFYTFNNFILSQKIKHTTGGINNLFFAILTCIDTSNYYLYLLIK